MNRIHITIALQPSIGGGITALVADHGTELPNSENPDIRVAKITDSSAEKVALMVGAALIGAMNRAGFDLGERDSRNDSGN
jgi:hypothetical protein